MFAILDVYLPKEITNLVLGYIPINYTHDVQRVYKQQTDAYGLLVPRKPFARTVWMDRLTGETKCGVKLRAARVLGLTRWALLVHAFGHVSYRSHALCNDGLEHLLRSEEIQPAEARYLLDHWNSEYHTYLTALMSRKTVHEILEGGFGELLAELMLLVARSETLAALLPGMAENILTLLESDNRRFICGVFIPFHDNFMAISELCHPNMRECLANYIAAL